MREKLTKENTVISELDKIEDVVYWWKAKCDCTKKFYEITKKTQLPKSTIKCPICFQETKIILYKKLPDNTACLLEGQNEFVDMENYLKDN